MKTTAILKNETGALMILITVMLLVLLTVISIAASRTAIIETKIAANEFAYQRCFYNSEGAIMEAVDLLDTDEDINPKDAVPEWMGKDPVVVNDNTVFANWEDEEEIGAVVPQDAKVDTTDTALMAVHRGILPGNSLDMTRPNKHAFSIYGRCDKDGLVMLTVGYNHVYE